jgi:hypothetical protein
MKIKHYGIQLQKFCQRCFFKYHIAPMIIQLLLEAGANIDLKDNDGRTAHMIASRIGYNKTVKDDPFNF